MNKSQLFKAAHALAKKIRQPGDDYKVTFGACIRFLAIREDAKMSAKIITSKSPKQAELAADKRDHIAFDMRAIARVFAQAIEDEISADPEMLEVAKSTLKAITEEALKVESSTDATEILKNFEISVYTFLPRMGAPIEWADFAMQEAQVSSIGKSRIYRESI